MACNTWPVSVTFSLSSLSNVSPNGELHCLHPVKIEQVTYLHSTVRDRGRTPPLGQGLHISSVDSQTAKRVCCVH